MFDPNSILSMSVEGASSTRIIPVPAGEYVATISRLDAREVERKDGTRAPIVRVVWAINDERAKEATGRENNSVYQDLWLDLTPSGALDMSEGSNVALGRLREAVGQNDPGRPWSFNQLIGRSARILVDHRTDDTGEVYAQVKKVSAI